MLRADIERAGYYPGLVHDVLRVALAGEPIVAHLLQPETTFDQAEVRRHLTAAVVTPTRLVVAHVDDHAAERPGDPPRAVASTESVPLRQIRSVVLSHGVSNPAQHRPGAPMDDLTIALGWGAVRRIDLEPAACGDPNCEADHGLTGTASPDDLVLRVSAVAEGSDAVRAALDFAQALSSSAHG